VQHINKNKPVLHADVVPSPRRCLAERPTASTEVELALQYTEPTRDDLTPSSNNISTPGGGTHLAACAAR